MLICDKVTREYLVGDNKNKQTLLALDNVSFTINKNEIFGLLGPNGAGKTSLIKIISTLLYPTKGNVYIDGVDVIKNSEIIKKDIGVLLANNRSLYMKLTAKENLEFFCSLYNIPYKEQKKIIDYSLKIVNLLDRKNDYVENFSHGMLQRLNIARSIIHNPKFIILDEPTNGLDPISTNELRSTILRLNNEGKTILISTHNMEEADILSNRLAIMNKGKIITEGTPQNIKNNLGNIVYEIKVKINNFKIEYILKIFNDIFINADIVCSEKECDTATLKIITKENYTFDYINDTLSSKNIQVSTISFRDIKLEDVFITSINNDRRSLKV